MVIVLHGGFGSAERIPTGQAEQGLNLDAEADRDGFVVAYLNGTPVTRRLGRHFRGWNAGGGCCGVPATDNVNDVGYLQGAIAMLSAEHGIEPHHVFAIGHSNGAMMIMRMMCETDSLAAAISVAGPLNTDASLLQIDTKLPVEEALVPSGFANTDSTRVLESSHQVDTMRKTTCIRYAIHVRNTGAPNSPDAAL